MTGWRPPSQVAVSYTHLDVYKRQLYARLMEEGLINPSFDVDYFDGPGYASWLMGGESRDPDAVCGAIRQEIRRLAEDGVDPAGFADVYKRQHMLSGISDKRRVTARRAP